MSLIIGENIDLRYGDHQVLRNVSFRIEDGDRIGLVGPNGEGKTTLLRIIAGQLETTGGDVHRRRGLRIGYLPQDPPALDGTTVHEAMLDVFSDVRLLERQLNETAAELEGHPELLKSYGQMQHEFEALGGYSYRNRVEQVLSGLGFSREQWDQPLAELSGGQRTRAYLATLLLRQSDVLLLDEPTNHLDIAACEWLEHWLTTFPAVLVVSHDRYLLDRVTARTWEVAFLTLEAYRGNYTKYLVLRDARYNERLHQWEAQQQYVKETEEFIRIHIAGQRTAEAKGRRKRLERFLEQDAVDKPRKHKSIHFSLKPEKRSGDAILVARRLVAGYDRPVVTADQLELHRGQRIAIVGPNGSGKTTLLRALLGQLEPLEGDVHQGAGIRYGYLSQTHAGLDPATSAVQAVVAAREGYKTDDARTLLGSLLLSGKDVFKRIDELSGGQRSRVALARLAVQGPNVLMLDEPTNHLDIPSMEILQDILRRFDGTLVFVSHDRYLIQALATHVWAIHGGRVHPILGSWEKYVEWRDRERPVAADTPKPRTREQQKTASRRSRKESTRLKRQLDRIERDIEATEAELARLGDAISDAADAQQIDALRKLSDDHQRLDAYLHELWAEWEQIGAQIE